MADQGGDKPTRTHLDEVAAMRETKRAKALEDRLDQRRAFLESPYRSGHANNNERFMAPPFPEVTPETKAEIDRILDELVLPKRETLVQRLDREATEHGQSREDYLRAKTEQSRSLEKLPKGGELEL